MNDRTFTAVTTSALALALAGTGHAQCDPVDFEAFSVGAIATSIVPGLTVNAIPGSCGGAGSVLPVIVQPFGGTSSGSRALSLQTGCPDFSPDILQLVFDDPQTSVEFTVGAQVGTAGLDFTVSWYDSGGGMIGSDTFDSAGGVNRLVRITGADIKRIEIGEALDFFECIDDLVFDLDTTPPTVELDSPTFDGCVCGDDVVPIVGTVGDADGDYQCDTASYRPVNADESDPWVEINTACGDFSGTLHDWDTTGVPAGRYYLRVVGANACGLTSSDVTVVRVDRSFGSVGITGFDGARDDGTLCGTVEVLGNIIDGCGVASWSVAYEPAGGGGFTEIASGDSERRCVIAEWDTTMVADGDYTLRVTATDTCGHTASDDVSVTVDNTGFCLCTADINGDGVVDFADLLLLLSTWG
jgi:hypothetical protein